MSTDPLFTPLRLGHYQVTNRIVMPPHDPLPRQPAR